MARIAGTATFESNPVEGAVVILYDESTNPATEVGRTTTNVSGEWEFLEVPVGTDYHVVAKWDDNGTLYQTKSFPFIETSDILNPASINNLAYWFSAEAGVNTTTVGDDEMVNYMENLATMAEAERIYPSVPERRPVLEDGYIQFTGANNTHLSHAHNPLGQYLGLTQKFTAINGKYTIAVAITEFNSGATAMNAGTTSDYDIFSLHTGDTRVRTPGTLLSVKAGNTLIATYRADRENTTADIYRENDAILQDIVINNELSSTSKFVIGGRTSDATTTPATFRLIEFLFYDRYVTLSELADIHNYMLRHLPA